MPDRLSREPRDPSDASEESPAMPIVLASSARPLRRTAGAVLLGVSLVATLGLGARALAEPRAASEAAEGENDGAGASASGDPESEPEAKPKPPRGLARVKVPEREGMLLVPGGRFPMGTNNPKAPPNERPQRIVTVGPFWLDRTEVTVGAYRACVEAKHCERPQVRSASCTYDLGDPELPVSCVRWSDADAFCKSVQKRLPAETEWEFAARGPEGYAYPWGNRFPDCKLANTLIRDNSGRACQSRPWRVGASPANASKFGVLDLGGNVEEWTADWYTERLGSRAPLSGASHTLRGGGWQSTPGRSRASTRDWGSVLESGPNVGFRCAKDAPASAPPAAAPRAVRPTSPVVPVAAPPPPP